MYSADYLAEAALAAFDEAQDATGEEKAHILAEGNLLASLAVCQRLREVT